MEKPYALIIGGTSGLGLALAEEAASRGIGSCVVGRRKVDTAPPIQAIRGDIQAGRSVFDTVRKHHGVLDRVTHLFFVAGKWLQGPFCESDELGRALLYGVHLIGPKAFLAEFHRTFCIEKRPYHLVVVSSQTAFRMRSDEALYAEVQAAKWMFARHFSFELADDLPGSKTMVVFPGGMKTEFYEGTEQDTSKFMDPRAVANVMWEHVLAQNPHYLPLSIPRGQNGDVGRVSTDEPMLEQLKSLD